MKKIISLVLVLLAAFSLVGCTKKKSTRDYVNECKEKYLETVKYEDPSEIIVTITVQKNQNYIKEAKKDSLIVSVYGTTIGKVYLCVDNNVYFYRGFLVNGSYDLRNEYIKNTEQGGTN